MNKHQKTINLLETFLSNLKVDGICGYMVDPDIDEHSNYLVHVILDIDYVKNANTKPGFVGKMIREGVKQEIKKWLGIDVHVGSTARKCEGTVKESPKKRYIITESQYKLLTESREMNWFKRRANKESMKQYITNAEINFPTLCDDFGNEFDYADNVIKWAIDEFMTINEDMFLDDKFDEFNEILVDMCKEWFGEYLFEIYRNTCTEENGY
jgi:hypothetical protein